MAEKMESPRWLRDLIRFLPLKSQFVLSGNVRDLQAIELAEGMITPQAFNFALSAELRKAGYSHVFIFNPLFGFQVASQSGVESQASESVLQSLGLTVTNGRAAASIDLLGQTLEKIAEYQQEPIALIIDFASRLATRVESMTPAEHQLFMRALILSHQAKTRPSGDQRKPFFNTFLWVVEREGDLPDWMIVDNPRIRHIPVSKPDRLARLALAPALLRPLTSAPNTTEELQQKAFADFVDGTEGLLLLDLNAIAVLARIEGVPLISISDAVRRYKVGVTEDPWLKIDKEKIRSADSFVKQRVKGQQQAVSHMLDLIKRAMTGIGGQRRGNRPRGVAFLAGPTGVGKTELAKTVTELLFGDEDAYIRFDMSEFSAEHSDQRLIGAPPGYIGYDVGGELTNAIRERPFSVVLFDEIEKAHPRVLDKFLQILDDGVLTSGRGDRVYFSEALIIFTSNLGIYKSTDSGERVPNVEQSDSYEIVKGKVLSEINRHFKLVLNRPEILNRIGENIIVFDFIRKDIAIKIFEQMVSSVLNDIKHQEINVTLHDDAMHALRELCLKDLSNGGRGIRNHVEANLVNPLARHLFDSNAQSGDHFIVNELQGAQLTLVKTSPC